MIHRYWHKKYGHMPTIETRDAMIKRLVKEEGLPQWAASSLVSLAESRCTLLITMETDRNTARSAINTEFYVTAEIEQPPSPQKSLQLENLEARK